MQSNRPPPYQTQMSPPTQYQAPLPGQQPYPQQQQPYPQQQNPYPFGPPPRATGVPGWAWVVLAVVVVGFLGLTAVVATVMVVAKSSAPDKRVAANGDDSPAPAPAPTSRSGSHNHGTLPPVERHVPFHDVSLLKGCSPTDITTIERRLDTAIRVGAPTYNAGDYEGCYTGYDSAAAKLELALSNTCTGPVTALESGRRTARAKDAPSDRAWAMRDSFDGLFDVIDRSQK